MVCRQAVPLLFFLFLVALPGVPQGQELKAHYVMINYEKKEFLQRFNDRLLLKGNVRLNVRKNGLTVADEVRGKTDRLTERVEEILDMFPERLLFTLQLLPTDLDVRLAYKRLYHRDKTYRAFYAPKEKTIFASVASINLRVLAHEVAHAIIDHYFVIPPPTKAQEILAQYAESQVAD